MRLDVASRRKLWKRSGLQCVQRLARATRPASTPAPASCRATASSRSTVVLRSRSSRSGNTPRNSTATSGPTSKQHTPIPGPMAACTSPGSVPNSTPMRRTVAAASSSRVPLQPQCTAATTRRRSSASSTGRQSAVRIRIHNPARRATRASPSHSRAPGASARTITEPCTCLRSAENSAGSHPSLLRVPNPCSNHSSRSHSTHRSTPDSSNRKAKPPLPCLWRRAGVDLDELRSRVSRLRDHNLLLEVLQHRFVQTHLGRPLHQCRHRVDLVL